MKWVMWIDSVDKDSVHFGIQGYSPIFYQHDYTRVFTISGYLLDLYIPNIAKELKDLRPGEVYDVEVQIRFPEEEISPRMTFGTVGL